MATTLLEMCARPDRLSGLADGTLMSPFCKVVQMILASVDSPTTSPFTPFIGQAGFHERAVVAQQFVNHSQSRGL